MNKSFDRNTALAICFSNLKGSKNKDLLLTARALEYLKELPEFRSNQRVGEQLGVSGEIVRQFISLLDLPSTIHQHLQDKKLGLEHGRRLWQLNRARPSIVEDAASAMASMTAMDARDLVEYLIKNPSASVPEALDTLEEAKPVITEEHLVCALLSRPEFEALVVHAREKNSSEHDLVSSIVRQWLKERNDNPI